MNRAKRGLAAVVIAGATATGAFSGGTVAAAAPADPADPAVAITAASVPAGSSTVEHVTFTAARGRTSWAVQTAQFAGCLGGFGFVAAPIVAGFMIGGPGGAVSAGKAWIPRLGPVGGGILRWCMSSVLGVRM